MRKCLLNVQTHQTTEYLKVLDGTHSVTGIGRISLPCQGGENLQPITIKREARVFIASSAHCRLPHQFYLHHQPDPARNWRDKTGSDTVWYDGSCYPSKTESFTDSQRETTPQTSAATSQEVTTKMRRTRRYKTSNQRASTSALFP